MCRRIASDPAIRCRSRCLGRVNGTLSLGPGQVSRSTRSSRSRRHRRAYRRISRRLPSCRERTRRRTIERSAPHRMCDPGQMTAASAAMKMRRTAMMSSGRSHQLTAWSRSLQDDRRCRSARVTTPATATCATCSSEPPITAWPSWKRPGPSSSSTEAPWTKGGWQLRPSIDAYQPPVGSTGSLT